MAEMKEKVALVTGGNSLIGREIAIGLAGAGGGVPGGVRAAGRVGRIERNAVRPGAGSTTATGGRSGISGVAVHYGNDRRTALEVVQEIRRKGVRSRAFRADLSHEKGASALVRKVEEEFGRVDILVNNFGPILVKPWQEVGSAEWEAVFRCNFLSAFHCLRSVLSGMRKRGWGRVINIGYGRVEQLGSFPTIAPYAVAKTGLLILTRTAAASEFASGRVTVNMVSPGLIEGGVLPQGKRIPRRNLGKPEDVARAVLFLVSEEAGRITGANLLVAGGFLGVGPR